MSFGNLSVNVTAEIGQFTSSMELALRSAQSKMAGSAEAVNDFKAQFTKASDDVAQAAKGVGANMAAANDEIIRKSAESAQAVEKVGEAMNSVDTESFAHRFGAAFGAAFGAGYAVAQTWLQKTEDFVIAKTKTIGIALAIGLVSATAAVGPIHSRSREIGRAHV